METSRCSTANLHHLTLTPVSPPSYPDTSTTVSRYAPDWPPRNSYLSQKSAPTTPGILSRNTSTTHLFHHSRSKTSSKSYTHLAFADAANFLPGSIHGHDGTHGSAMTKSKSTTTLPQAFRPIRRKKQKQGKLGAGNIVGTDDGGEWLFRAGTAISSEARESKGQSWLLHQSSSTSLVAQNMGYDDDDDDDDGNERHVLLTGGYDGAGMSRGSSARGSRNGSRVASTRTSRRGSSVWGSRADLGGGVGSMTPKLRTRTPLREMGGGGDYFGGAVGGISANIAGPDFVDEVFEDEDEDGFDEDDEDEDSELRDRLEEAEVAKLAQARGFGLGGFVDRLVGWTLFEVGDEGEVTEEDETSGGMKGYGGEQERDEMKGRRESVGQGLQFKNGKKDKEHKRFEREEEENGAKGGWSDAAWLLSVATKALLEP